MLYTQPLALRFGNELIAHIKSGTWTNLDIAVAWIRASGIRHLEPALKLFLKAGGRLDVVVGIDFDNTTKEGLERLLQLRTHGNVSVWIHHNESGPIFHPKLYLFRNAEQAKLVVGSNNITEAGLFRNTEVGLEIDTVVGDPVIGAALDAIDSWRDPTMGLAHQLDAPFLASLVAAGYIKDEATVRAEHAARRAAVPKGGKAAAGAKLFGSVNYAAPPLLLQGTTPGATTSVTVASSKSAKPLAKSPTATVPTAIGQVLLMRVRKARGTQVQIPIRVLSTPFFGGATSVMSVANGVTRGIHPTHARRAGPTSNPNTLKLEMPETSTMSEPVARFERTAAGIQYEVYDASSAKGHAIMQTLTNGLATVPPSTLLTVPSSPANATWWRFI